VIAFARARLARAARVEREIRAHVSGRRSLAVRRGDGAVRRHGARARRDEECGSMRDATRECATHRAGARVDVVRARRGGEKPSVRSTRVGGRARVSLGRGDAREGV